MAFRTLVLPLLVCLAGSLAAQDQKAKAQALVKEAIAFERTNGREALLKETNQGTGRFHVKGGDDLYIFVYDLKGTCLAIGFQSQLVGVNRWNAKDPDGNLFIQEIIQKGQAKGGNWVDYKYTNPKNGKVEAKTSFVEAVDGMVVGCGIYK
ncbi:MAG TPA: cache domain-containing protein [Holophagaceae bacterium]